MSKEQKSSDIEYSKRVRAVVEWLIDDWSAKDICSQCVQSWGVTERQSYNYIKEAKKYFKLKEDEKLEEKRNRRLFSLYKLKRKMEKKYEGTPSGVAVLLKIEQTIIDLEGVKPALKHEHSGANGTPIQSETTHRVIFENYAE